MIHSTNLTKAFAKGLCILFVPILSVLSLLLPAKAFCQETAATKLEKWPPDLERDFALSALPPHLRKEATVYLLDPTKGYYIAKKGTNGFICYIERTSWEWGVFRKDVAAPISYDAEGARTIFTVVMDVAAMRASGKYTAKQIQGIVIDKIKKGIYKAPSRSGISYMLAPLMRVYPGLPPNNQVMSMSMPHYMFYAPYINNADIGGDTTNGPFVNNPSNAVLGDGKGPYGFIIMPAGKAEQAEIVKAGSDLLKRLAAYKPYLKASM
ncbi:MAG: hypothetical protein JST50_14855 [Bacteroidetes bacterium]|jgi:hypothetical protein|nr:hypothetical protein [Bacteroidota bacterium]